MRSVTRWWGAGLMAGLVLAAGLAGADEAAGRPATKEQQQEAKERAEAIELLVEADRLEASAEKFKLPALYVAAGALYLKAKAMEKGFQAVKVRPEEVKDGDKPEAELPMEARARRAFAKAKEISGGSEAVAAMVKEAEAGKATAKTRGNILGPFRMTWAVPGKGKHTYRFAFRGGQVALVGFSGQANLRFHVGTPKLGLLATLNERGATWSDVIVGPNAAIINVHVHNPHSVPVLYTIYTN